VGATDMQHFDEEDLCVSATSFNRDDDKLAIFFCSTLFFFFLTLLFLHNYLSRDVSALAW